jgi:hypothetical protein
MIYKNCGRKNPKVVEILDNEKPKKVLIVFWHGIGDLLMFYPIFKKLKKLYDYEFTLGLIPGVGHSDLVEGVEIPEEDFLKNHDMAFVISFHMVEGLNKNITKAEWCAQQEIGLETFNSFLPSIPKKKNKLVGVHFQGTCLPGSTNPDEATAKQIWFDLVDAGYIPIDLHFKHVFHNPVNKRYDWQQRSCRDIKPSLNTLTMLIQQCFAVVAVASGPFVISLCNNPNNTIYLKKRHKIECYTKNFNNVVDLENYNKQDLLSLLNNMEDK